MDTTSLLLEIRHLSSKVENLLTLRDSFFPPPTAISHGERTQQFITAEDVYAYVQPMQDLEQEYALVLCLDAKNRLLHEEVVSKGTANCAFLHPRDVFRTAVRVNAVSLIVVHCHPSGDSSPSSDDLTTTERLANGASLLGIRLQDHLIVGRNQFCSLKKFHPHFFLKGDS